MEWCHQIPFINALMIYWCRPNVIVIIFQHRDFASMCLAVLTHIPQYVSAITKGFHLVINGESWERYFLTSMFLVVSCVMKCRLVCHAHVFMYLSMYLDKNKRCKCEKN